ncbi:UDP-glucose dehydrogenase family protein [Paenibacillus radicis (ex Xue et al. 2023)]|uniref:UDP-glucose 6-dehydrogenase n=1 Tax=Paenibacillus radicis (ex Xue et al. 2023) TaxID=2972489 RepID=A0ABT1YI99_9BACL|nr:UDP-glucose/GDP-mannose dehydrogenase family protein [Paenibacillus radicis (ex Xue et al. 2023)]MCR8632903.1 UDP-glucose/GDP-mannose dehydrogenase family protein [Paenibacillus radicis (ex Xue et al. 2023)]
MNILIMGTGYVGVTTGLVFAELGWNVTGLDPDQKKTQSLSQGELTFYEPGLNTLLREHLQSGRIRFTSEPEMAVRDSNIIFLCVGTPSDRDGNADLQFIRQASESIGRYMQEYKVIAIKSTVPIGTNHKLSQWITNAQTVPVPFDVVSNPEFLREGSALHDALHPDRIIIGCESDHAIDVMKTLYEKIQSPFFVTKPKTAEMIKYASNAFLATKISYVNELSRLCENIEVNISDVAEGMGMDHRIGPHFLRAGIGYGGSCFPKDINAMLYMAKQYGAELSILEKVIHVNQTQYSHYLKIWEQKLGTFRDKKIAILGISFKPDTDDLREAPSISIIEHLLESGAAIRVHDPAAKLPPDLLSEQLLQVDLLEEALEQCDAIILCSEWEHYKKADWTRLKALMNQHFVFDGRNVLDGNQMTILGYHYYGIGRHLH